MVTPPDEERLLRPLLFAAAAAGLAAIAAPRIGAALIHDFERAAYAP